MGLASAGWRTVGTAEPRDDDGAGSCLPGAGANAVALAGTQPGEPRLVQHAAGVQPGW